MFHYPPFHASSSQQEMQNKFCCGLNVQGEQWTEEEKCHIFPQFTFFTSLSKKIPSKGEKNKCSFSQQYCQTFVHFRTVSFSVSFIFCTHLFLFFFSNQSRYRIFFSDPVVLGLLDQDFRIRNYLYGSVSDPALAPNPSINKQKKSRKTLNSVVQ